MTNHKFKKGDKVRVFNAPLSRKTIYEGEATIIDKLEVPDQYQVKFKNDNGRYRRFCYFSMQDQLPEDLAKLVNKR